MNSLDSLTMAQTIGGRTYRLEAEVVARYPGNVHFLALLNVSLTRDRSTGRYLKQQQHLMVRTLAGTRGVPEGAGREFNSYAHQFSQVAAAIEDEAARAGQSGRYAASTELKRFAHRVTSELRSLAENSPTVEPTRQYTS